MRPLPCSKPDSEKASKLYQGPNEPATAMDKSALDVPFGLLTQGRKPG
jgi:hypothetical protein